MLFLPSMQSGTTRVPSAGVWVAIYPLHPRRNRLSCHPRVTAWTAILHPRWPHVTKPHATVLAVWSLGMGLARSGALTAVSALLAAWLHRQAEPVRQPWRAFGSEATAQRGTARPALVVETGCVPRLVWGVAQWEGPHVALAREATTLGTRVPVVALRGVSRGWAIPGAWTVLPATATHAWRRAWVRRRRQGRRAGPRSWPVMGLAARGWDARWRLRRLTRLGWPPFVRLNTGGTFRPQGHVRAVPLQRWVPEPGTTWQGTGSACTGRHRQLPCPLLAGWEAGDTAPWGLLPDGPPAARTACWYGWRAWRAQGCKRTQRAGWQGPRTRMPTPARAARLWLAGAVAPLGWLRVGGEADEASPASTVPEVRALIPMPRRRRRATRLRRVRVLRRGWTIILVALLEQAPRPLGRCIPEPWPAVTARRERAPLLPDLGVPLAA